jgi:hypothetical protein
MALEIMRGQLNQMIWTTKWVQDYIGKHRLEVFCLILEVHLHFTCYTRLKIEVNLQDVKRNCMEEEDAKENWNLF